MLRWLTAGESHGPALVADPRGAAGRRRGHHRRRRRRPRPAPARLRPRRADELRAGRGRRSSAASGTGRTHRAARSPSQVGNTEWPKWEQVMSADPVDPDVLAGPGPQRPADPPAARPRRPRRHAEVRLRRRPAGPRAGQRARDRGPGRARRGGPGVPRARRPASRCVSHVVELGAVRGARRASCPGPATSTRVDADPVRCLDPDAARRDGRRDRRGPHATATPSAASSRWSSTACRPGSAATCTGTGGSTPGWPVR